MPPDPARPFAAPASAGAGAASPCDALIHSFTYAARSELSVAIALADANQTEQNPEQVRHAFRHLLARLVPLLDGLSDMNDLEHGPSTATAQAIDLLALVTDAAEALQADHPARYIDVSFASPLPAALAVGHQASRIVERLLYNAVTYTSGDIFVHLAANAATARVCVTVSDEGPAWPAESRELVFARLAKLPEAPGHWPRYTLQLGLYFARALARQLDGEVELESNANGGNDFRLCLPACPPGG